MGKEKYSLFKGIIKGLTSIAIWIVPVLISILPDSLINMNLWDSIISHLPEGLTGLTVGCLLTMIFNWLKNKDN